MAPSSIERSKYVSAGLLAAAALIYALWLSNRTFRLIIWPSHSPDTNLLFNSMLEHMLRGRFDVDPAIVDTEGFARGGRIYADWGIVPALIRLPLLLFPGGLQLDVTRLSMWLAATTAATIKFGTLRVMFRIAAGAPAALLYWSLLLAILFGGAQIEFLKPSVYQEACLWAGTLGAGFVFLAIRGLVAGSFSLGALCGMAAIAGAAMLSRATIGVGLCIAMVLLLVVKGVQSAPIAAGPIWKRALTLARDLGLQRSVLMPVAVLALFAVLTGFVNYERWGNPLVFADYHRYFYYNHYYPDRLIRLEQYGVFNPERIPFGVIYYFFPVWVLQRADGHQLFYEHETRLFNSLELPPSTFLLSDMLLVALGTFAVWALVNRHKLPIARPIAVAIAAGLSASCFLILSFDVLSFRYRIDFQPFIEFVAFVGGVLMLQSPFPARRLVRWGPLAASATSIFVSWVELVLYRFSDFGTAAGLKPDILDYYVQRLGEHLARYH